MGLPRNFRVPPHCDHLSVARAVGSTTALETRCHLQCDGNFYHDLGCDIIYHLSCVYNSVYIYIPYNIEGSFATTNMEWRLGTANKTALGDAHDFMSPVLLTVIAAWLGLVTLQEARLETPSCCDLWSADEPNRGSQSILRHCSWPTVVIFGGARQLVRVQACTNGSCSCLVAITLPRRSCLK